MDTRLRECDKRKINQPHAVLGVVVEHGLSFFKDALIFLLATVVVVPLFMRLRASFVLGFLAAGALIGGHGFALVADSDSTRVLAELGVVFLLFTIGLELSFERLRVMRRHLLGTGSAQVLATGVVFAALARACGLSIEAAVIVGGGLALSSTAVVLQLLSERGELATRAGRVAFAILLLQDLAVIPLLAIVAAMSGAEGDMGSSALLGIVKAVAVIAALFVLGRLVLHPAFRFVAASRSSELFAALTLLVLLIAAGTTALVGLSMALGGFLAGLLLADTEYRHQVEAEIQPFRGLLLGLFFLTVGMSIDLALGLNEAALVIALVVALLASKAAIIYALARLWRMPVGPALQVGLVLAQGGEFAFVLFGLASGAALLPKPITDILIVVVAVSMAATPVLAALGARLSRRAEARAHDNSAAMVEETADLANHVVIAGFGRVGQSIAKVLGAAQVPWVAIEAEPTRVAEARAKNLPVFYGDGSRVETLRAASKAAGATDIVSETYEMSLQLGGAILRGVGTAHERVDDIIAAHRADNYARLGDVIFPAVARGAPKAAE